MTRRTADGAPALAEELRRRSEQVPLLRLPLPATGDVRADFDRAVVLCTPAFRGLGKERVFP